MNTDSHAGLSTHCLLAGALHGSGNSRIHSICGLNNQAKRTIINPLFHTANKKAHSWMLTRSGRRSAVWGRVGWQGWKGRGSGGSFKRIRGKGKRNCGSVRLHSSALHKRQNWFNFHLSTSTYPLLPHDWPRPLACPQIAWFSHSRIHHVIV